MKKVTLSLVLIVGFLANTAFAQTALRYKNEVFTDAQIQSAKGIPFAVNLNWLIINQTDLGTPSNGPQVMAELTELKTLVATGKKFQIPIRYYRPKGTPNVVDTTILKVTTLRMDAYMPDPSVDASTSRPVVIYLHTGNFLPPGTNGSPCGNRNDSSVVDICKGLARRGFIAIAMDYRLGWNPIGATIDIRRGTLLNAVYRAIHDVKECVRVVKSMGATYEMDTANIAIVGEGTGAYIAHAYSTLDKYPEFMANPKFMGYIDTAKVGLIDGSRGTFNLYTKSTVNTRVKVIGTLGGALADSTWLEAGDAPVIAMQCVRDPFAPFGYGLVIVPTGLLPVVNVYGANSTTLHAQNLGINSIFAAIPSADPYTIKARSLYNRTVDYIRAPPEDKITIRNGEGMYPFLLPKGATEFLNQASPWQWWDSTSAQAKIDLGGGFTTHANAKQSNPDMSKAKSRRYQDTIHGYMTRRIAYKMGYLSASDLGITKAKVTGIAIYPNPASNSITITYKGVINSITITDLTGKAVYQSYVNSSSVTIPSLNLRQGLYIVNVSTEQGNSVEKLVIK